MYDNQIQYCLVVDFRYLVKNLTRWDFLKWPKACYIWIRFSVLEHYNVTTLQVVARCSPLLRIPQSFFLTLGPTRYIGDLSGYLIPALWECMSADSWYSGLALSIKIRSKAILTVYDIWQFKIIPPKKFKIKFGSKKWEIIIFNSVTFLAVTGWNTSKLCLDWCPSYGQEKGQKRPCGAWSCLCNCPLTSHCSSTLISHPPCLRATFSCIQICLTSPCILAILTQIGKISHISINSARQRENIDQALRFHGFCCSDSVTLIKKNWESK